MAFSVVVGLDCVTEVAASMSNSAVQGLGATGRAYRLAIDDARDSPAVRTGIGRSTSARLRSSLCGSFGAPVGSMLLQPAASGASMSREIRSAPGVLLTRMVS
ncbi:hypothetical protein CH259_10025 [Rhodococcus sp. 05-2254-4]|nr:hypothetical protein CH259_10025 [Rhodococcus sp. 05-2254-4]OZE45364.1 hypothetical protein CH283_23655 [Rhodococcus sp. 05-2254-2]